MVGYFLILAIIILGGVIAMVGDRIGSRVGKARLSLFNLRPKKTAVLVTILTGSVTAASTMAILLATNQQLRDAVFRIEDIQRQSQEAQADLDRALEQQDKMQARLALTQTKLNRSTQQLKQINRSLKQAIARQQRSEKQLKQFQARFAKIKRNLEQSTAQAKTLRAQIKRLATEERQLRSQQQQLLTQRDQAQAQLTQAQAQKQASEAAAAQAQAQLQQAQTQLQQRQARLTQVQAQLVQARAQRQASEIAAAQIQTQLQQAEVQKQQLETEVTTARQQVEQANAQRAELIAQQTQLQTEITELETNRQQLARTIDDLQTSVEALLLGLRRGNITIRTGQILAEATVQNLTTREAALQTVDALLLQARRQALGRIQLAPETAEQQVIQISKQDVERLVQQISDGQAYVIRILAIANYLQGEQSVGVVPQLARNDLVFQPGDVVARITLQPAQLSDEQLLVALTQLFQMANRRALEAQMLPNPLTGTVGEFEQIELFRFLLALQDRKLKGTVEILAIAAAPVSVAGPLQLELIAVQNQRVILRSG